MPADTGERLSHDDDRFSAVAWRTSLIQLSNSDEGASPRSRGAMRPEFCVALHPPSSTEGAGKAGCALHPRSRVQIVQGNAHTSIQVQRRQSGFPCAMGYGLLRALPGDRLSCHRHQADTSAKLDASTGAPGPHDLMSSRFFGLLKTAETPEIKGFFRFLLKEQKALRNPPGPNRP